MKLDVPQIMNDCLVRAFGLDQYLAIMEMYDASTDLRSDIKFQRKFNAFYKVRRDGPTWQPRFYAIFNDLRKHCRPLDFRAVLEELYEVSRCVDASFVSKMFATVDPTLPIIDKFVLKNTGLNIEGKDAAEKIANAVATYSRLKTIYRDYLESKEGRDSIRYFDSTFPAYADRISATKKLDCLVWAKQ